MTCFEDYHRRRRTAALSYARSVLGGDRAEDACQEAWIRAWKTWGAGKAGQRDGWMATLLRTSCDAQVPNGVSTESLVVEELPPQPSFEDDSVAALEVASLWTLLSGLPAPMRDVLFLRGVLDLSYAEIAQVQRVPIGTVMSRLHEARRRARARLQNSRKIEYFSEQAKIGA